MTLLFIAAPAFLAIAIFVVLRIFSEFISFAFYAAILLLVANYLAEARKKSDGRSGVATTNGKKRSS